jgi:hypothetical protein
MLRDPVLVQGWALLIPVLEPALKNLRRNAQTLTA